MKCTNCSIICLLSLFVSCVSTKSTESTTQAAYVDMLWVKAVQLSNEALPSYETDVATDANPSISSAMTYFNDYLFFASTGKLFHQRFPDSTRIDFVIKTIEHQIQCSSEGDYWKEIDIDVVEWIFKDFTDVRRYGNVTVDDDTLTWDLWNYQNDTTQTVKSFASGKYGFLKKTITVPEEKCDF